jgi:DNA-binding MarR family transcriptional regulator
VKELIAQLDPAFDHRNRLGIMALLLSNECIDYNTLRNSLQLTDGNLASHLKPLETQGFISFQKVFIGRKPQTTYAVTAIGRDAFLRHLEALEAIVALAREGE